MLGWARRSKRKYEKHRTSAKKTEMRLKETVRIGTNLFSSQCRGRIDQFALTHNAYDYAQDLSSGPLFLLTLPFFKTPYLCLLKTSVIPRRYLKTNSADS